MEKATASLPVIPVLQEWYQVGTRDTQRLLEVLVSEGFILEQEAKEPGASASLVNDQHGIEAHVISGNGHATRLTLIAKVSEYGMDPAYLRALVGEIRKADLSIRSTERVNFPYNQYTWEDPLKRVMLAGSARAQVAGDRKNTQAYRA